MHTVFLDASGSFFADFWENILATLVRIGGSVLTIVVVAALSILLSWLVRVIIRRIVKHIISRANRQGAMNGLFEKPLAEVRIIQRTRTLGTLTQNICNIAIVVIAAIAIIALTIPQALTSLALLSAAIGAAIGFGARDVIKDTINGIFMVAEDQIGIGDIVDMEKATGVVEYAAIRITQIRDVEGTLWYVRNGEVTRIGNKSKGWARAIIDLPIPIDCDVAQIEKNLLSTAHDLAADSQWKNQTVDAPEVWGLQSISGDCLVTRLVIKTTPAAKSDVSVELRRRVMAMLHRTGVTLPPTNTLAITHTNKPVWQPKTSPDTHD